MEEIYHAEDQVYDWNSVLQHIKIVLCLTLYLVSLGLTKGVAKEGMAHFEEMMRQQLENSMHTELEKLLDTTTGAEREVYQLSVSLFLPPSLPPLWPSGCDLVGWWGSQCWENTKVTHTRARCQEGFHLHADRNKCIKYVII